MLITSSSAEVIAVMLATALLISTSLLAALEDLRELWLHSVRCLLMIIIIILNTTACVAVIEMVRFLSVYSHNEDQHPQYTREHMSKSLTLTLLCFALFCLNIDIQYEVISLYSHSIKADSDYNPTCLLVFGVKSNVRTKLHRIGSILFDWFENRTHSKIDVRFCSIAEPNRTPIVRLSSIGFLFDFVRLDTPGL